MKPTTTPRTQWIDCAKFVAILCVLIDHSFGHLYANPQIQMAVYCSVSVFILLAGYTLYRSAVRRNDFGYGGLWRRIQKILLPYLVAVLVVELVTTRAFDWEYYWLYATHFNISTPHYYVLLYIQMLIAAPVLINAVRAGRRGSTIATVLAVVALSVFTTNNTSILNIYGGGGRVFGGTYLILLLFGIIAARYDLLHITKRWHFAAGTAITAVAWLVWWQILCRFREQIDGIFPFGEGVNPPGVGLMVQGVLVVLLVYFTVSFLESWNARWINRVLQGIGWLGQRTLYIFLYHMLFQTYLLKLIPPEQMLFRRILLLPGMVILPLLTQWGIQKIKGAMLPLVNPSLLEEKVGKN